MELERSVAQVMLPTLAFRECSNLCLDKSAMLFIPPSSIGCFPASYLNNSEANTRMSHSQLSMALPKLNRELGRRKRRRENLYSSGETLGDEDK